MAVALNGFRTGATIKPRILGEKIIKAKRGIKRTKIGVERKRVEKSYRIDIALFVFCFKRSSGVVESKNVYCGASVNGISPQLVPRTREGIKRMAGNPATSSRTTTDRKPGDRNEGR